MWCRASGLLLEVTHRPLPVIFSAALPDVKPTQLTNQLTDGRDSLLSNSFQF